MVDVKSFDCFPTAISQFSLEINHEPIIEIVNYRQICQINYFVKEILNL